MEATRARGVPDGKVYLDLLAMTLATNTDSALVTLDTMRAIRREFPDARLTMGLSNLPFGLPAPSYTNRAFLTLALAAGLDCVIFDPLDRDWTDGPYWLGARAPHCVFERRTRCRKNWSMPSPT